ncbi:MULTISPECIES: hypothetical protein [unclassified Acinetobacter]|uniref:hypothetical protein n=1 Tax=unclassified Acinetobacter TaxID=196816 RepID=UPI002575E1C3|nr:MULTISPECIES: hypothetical protein [unclassified Acinetobacter]MDM1765731.1 hypothetical protein [Acinetobacter sp. 226-1]MDM1769382.1 hypothetical protein [Acinetobacter sp. 226-4]
MKQQGLINFFYQNEDFIKCPVCGDPYTHQGKVEIFERCEDETQGNHVQVLDDNIQVDRDLSRNPSPRRQGVSIHFKCESGSHSFIVDIYQHKGQTFFEIKSN